MSARSPDFALLFLQGKCFMPYPTTVTLRSAMAAEVRQILGENSGPSGPYAEDNAINSEIILDLADLGHGVCFL